MKSRAVFRTASLLFLLLSLAGSNNVWAMGKKPPKPSLAVTSSEPTDAPLTLKDCFSLALAQSEAIAIRAEEIEATEAQFFKAASEALGDVHFKMTQFRQDAQAGAGSDGIGSTFNAQLRRERYFEMSQPLFQGFKTLAALRAAGALREQRTAEYKRGEELLFYDVARTFYSVLRYQKDLKTSEDIQKLLDERVGELKERETIGRSRSSEVATAHARLKTIEASLARTRGDLAIAKLGLEFLTGTPISEDQLLDEDLPASDDPKELMPYLAQIEDRADVEALRQAYRIARQGIISAQSALWPTITVDTNMYEMREGFQSGIDWDVLFTIDVPLFQGGAVIGSIKEAKSKRDKAELSYDLVKREAAFDVREAHQEWLTSLDRYRALVDAAGASEENFKLQNEEYGRNLVNNLDVLEALELLNETRKAANEALYQMKENYWGLKVAVGEIA